MWVVTTLEIIQALLYLSKPYIEVDHASPPIARFLSETDNHSLGNTLVKLAQVRPCSTFYTLYGAGNQTSCGNAVLADDGCWRDLQVQILLGQHLRKIADYPPRKSTSPPSTFSITHVRGLPESALWEDLAGSPHQISQVSCSFLQIIASLFSCHVQVTIASAVMRSVLSRSAYSPAIGRHNRSEQSGSSLAQTLCDITASARSTVLTALDRGRYSEMDHH